MTTCLDFQSTGADADLRNQFLNEASGMNLGKIIRDNKTTIRLSFHKTTIQHLDIYLVMVVGNNDHILIKLAAQTSFPRGFPVIWIPGKMMQYFGFYPKFSNDDRQTADNMTEFTDVESISFFKKWSGFLGQVIVFQFDSNLYWTAVSKNSASSDSQFVIDAKRMFNPLLSDNVLETMAKNQIHLCAEMMSINDQTHGTRVFCESPVITAVGIGKKYDLANGVATIKEDGPFVDFFNHSDLVEFCQKHSLPCDSAITISGKAECQAFLLELTNKRDFMNDDNLEQLLCNLKSRFDPAKIIVNSGTITHKNLLGDCLEGLVLRLTTGKSSIIKKYKFPTYTVRTMLLREQLKNFVFGYDLMTKARNFVEYWCVSSEGKEYWYNFALSSFITALQFVPKDNQVGTHIQLAEFVQSENHDENSEFKFRQTLASMPKVTVVLVVGPIASGKTSFANKLASLNTDFLSVDGDSLDIGEDLVKILGKERNDYTTWNVKKGIMEGKVVILSCGGGVLFSQAKNPLFILREQIQATFGLGCKIILCVAGNFTEITILDKNHDPIPFYQDVHAVKQAIHGRVKSGVWKVDPKFSTGKTSEKVALENFATFIAKKSCDNSMFATKLLAEADCIFGFPAITQVNYGIQNQFQFASILSQIEQPKPITNGKFGQIRLLTGVSNGGNKTIGHITWAYDATSELSYTMQDFQVLANKYPSEINGNFNELSSPDNKKPYTFVTPCDPIHADGSTHITIDSSIHSAKETKGIVLAMKNGKNTIELPMQNGSVLEYDLTKIKINSCTIHVLAAFGI